MESEYSPRTLDEMINASENVERARRWIRNRPPAQNTMFIFGKIGSGKSTFARLLASEAGYKPHVFTFLDMRAVNSGSIASSTKAAFRQLRSDILSTLDVFENKYHALIIEDVESISKNDKTALGELTALLKENDQRWRAPIILTSTLLNSKKVSQFANRCFEITLTPPSEDQMMAFIGRIARAEQIVFSEDHEARQTLARQCAEDFRRIFLVLDQLAARIGPITISELEEAFAAFQCRDIDVGLFELTERVFREPMTYEDLEVAFDSEKTLLPQMIYENYPRCAEDVDDCARISDSISISDVSENIAFTEQLWNMSQVQALFSTIIPIYNVPPDVPEKKLSQFVFSKLLTKSSTAAKKRDDLIQLCAKLGSVGIFSSSESFSADFHLLSRKFSEFIDTDDPAGGAEYLRSIGLSVTDLDKMSRLIPVKNARITIPPKFKRKIDSISEKTEAAKKKPRSIRLEDDWEPSISITMKK